MPAPSYRDELGRTIPPLEGPNGEASQVVRRSGALQIPLPGKLPAEAASFLKQRQAHPSEALPQAPAPSSTSHVSLKPASAFGPYAVLGRVASSEDAEVFLAQDTRIEGRGRRVALKLLRESADCSVPARAKLLAQAERATRLVHPNLCHTYEAGALGSTVYMAVEWTDSRSLPELITALQERGQGLLPHFAAYVIAQAAYALDAAHTTRDQRGTLLDMAHLRIHPGSIAIGFDGTVKLLGFGMPAPATPTSDQDEPHGSARLGYRAPEQLLGGPVDGRADIFSLGVCLYEMLTGLRLHRRATVRGTVSAVLDERPASLKTSLPELPELLDVIVLRALEKRPDHRFQRAGELAAALEAYLASCSEMLNPRRVARLMSRLYPDDVSRHRPLSRDEAALSALEYREVSTSVDTPAEVQRIVRTTAIGIGLMTLALLALTVLGAMRFGH